MIWEYICRVDCHDVNGVKTWADKFRCPVCGFIHTCVENHGLYNYCPQCGERMKQPHQSVTVETRWDADDIKTPPFTYGQKKIIQATEKLEKICDVDEDI